MRDSNAKYVETVKILRWLKIRLSRSAMPNMKTQNKI